MASRKIRKLEKKKNSTQPISIKIILDQYKWKQDKRLTITTINPHTFSYIGDVIRSIFININVCQSITLSYFTGLPSGMEFRKYRLMSRQLDSRVCVGDADRKRASSCG